MCGIRPVSSVVEGGVWQQASEQCGGGGGVCGIRPVSSVVEGGVWQQASEQCDGGGGGSRPVSSVVEGGGQASEQCG